MQRIKSKIPLIGEHKLWAYIVELLDDHLEQRRWKPISTRKTLVKATNTYNYNSLN